MIFNEKTLKKIDIILLIIFPIIATVISLLIKANFLVSTLLFFGLPASWLSYRTPHKSLKTLIFSAIFALPFGIIIDYITAQDGSWYVPTTIFPFRLLGVIPIEDLIWGFLLVYTVVIFYEHFLDKGKHELIDKKMKYFILPAIILFILFLLIYSLNPDFLRIKYAYLLIGIVLILLPSITFLSFFPKLISKYVKTACYFFILSFMFEMTGLQLNQWTFPGQNFIGWIEILGHKFPFEEFFFWFIMVSIGILSYYEFFDDDEK